MCGFSFTVFLSAFQLLPTAPFHILALGGGTSAAGLFLGFLTYASAFSAPITGSLADRVGTRKILIVASIAITVFSIAYALIPSYKVMLALVLVHGLFWSGLLTGSAAYMTNILPESRRAEGIAYWGLSTIAAIAVAPTIGFWMFHFGWRALCLEAAGLNIVMAIIAWCLPTQVIPAAPGGHRPRRLVEWRIVALLRMARTMVEFYCGNFRQVPRRIVLDVDDTFDAVHGEQQLRLFNAHYDEYGFQPIVVFDGEGRPVAAMLRPAKRPSGREARAFLRRLVRAIRGHWPRVEILIRADSHYCAPEVLDFCRAEGLDFMLGVASTTTLRRHIEALERSTAALRTATPGAEKQRRYKEFLDAAGSWSRVERIIARVEAGPEGVDTRFVVTNLSGGSARNLYERKYCKRGQAEDPARTAEIAYTTVDGEHGRIETRTSLVSTDIAWLQE